MQKMQMKKGQSGFTLIELVVVIVILGILAATAIPRFTGMSTDARKAAVKGMLGAVQSASAIVHAQALVEGKTAATTPAQTVTLEGVQVNLVYGYPTAQDAGIKAALSAMDGFTYTSATGKFSLDGAPTPADCSVIYTAPTAANAAPTIQKVDSGC